MEVVERFLDLLKVRANKRYFTQFLRTHPFCPSILCYSDLLDEYKVENAAIRIDTKQNFCEIPVPFIAKIQSSDGDFCLITKLNKEMVTYLTEQGKSISQTIDLFFRQYSGVVLVADPDMRSAEPNYLANKKKFRNESIRIILGAIIILSLSLSRLFALGSSGSIISLFFVKVVGLIATILLLNQTYFNSGGFVSKFCSTSSGNGCEDILNSPASKIFNGRLSWSEVGFFYFSSTLLLLLIDVNASSCLLLLVLNLLCLPYTVYSIWHQYKIAEKWCRICVSVQICLWLEFFCLTAADTVQTTSLTQMSSEMGKLLCALLLILLLWYSIKPLLEKLSLVEKMRRDINQFKKDESIFYTLLEQQRSVSSIPEEGTIVFGNPYSNFEIIFVSNPYCQPCSVMYRKLKDLLRDENENITLKVIYTASSDPADRKNTVISAFIAAYKNEGALVAGKMMDEWYDKGISNPSEWLKKTGILDASVAEPTMDIHKLWCDENEITHTPAIFINNHLYLSEYSFSDLKYFIRAASNKQYAQKVPLA